MKNSKKESRYIRLFEQLMELCTKQGTPLSRMATIAAVLHHKMEHFFWTGFYLLEEGDLCVGPYQGPVACQVLEKSKGVCWEAVERDSAVIVPDVSHFPGHISCDPRSKSEITLPVKDKKGSIMAVLDIDAKEVEMFDEVDEKMLKQIVSLVYNEPRGRWINEPRGRWINEPMG